MKNIEIVAQYKALNNIPQSTMLYTYGVWKSKGYKVRKGERCKYRVPMWGYSEKTVKAEDGEEQKRSSCYTKTMNLFDQTQVEKIS